MVVAKIASRSDVLFRSGTRIAPLELRKFFEPLAPNMSLMSELKPSLI